MTEAPTEAGTDVAPVAPTHAAAARTPALHTTRTLSAAITEHLPEAQDPFASLPASQRISLRHASRYQAIDRQRPDVALRSVSHDQVRGHITEHRCEFEAVPAAASGDDHAWSRRQRAHEQVLVGRIRVHANNAAHRGRAHTAEHRGCVLIERREIAGGARA